jgi:hypothetical protein
MTKLDLFKGMLDATASTLEPKTAETVYAKVMDLEKAAGDMLISVSDAYDVLYAWLRDKSAELATQDIWDLASPESGLSLSHLETENVLRVLNALLILNGTLEAAP